MRISDWSSDVCSSDLLPAGPAEGRCRQRGWLPATGRAQPPAMAESRTRRARGSRMPEEEAAWLSQAPGRHGEIGRASGRASGCQYVEKSVVGVSLKKKHIGKRHSQLQKIKGNE